MSTRELFHTIKKTKASKLRASTENCRSLHGPDLVGVSSQCVQEQVPWTAPLPLTYSAAGELSMVLTSVYIGCSGYTTDFTCLLGYKYSVLVSPGC